MKGLCEIMEDRYNPIVDEIKEKELLEKYANYFFLLHFWMEKMEEGKVVNDFFDDRGYRKIAIYGMGQLGHHLKNQLADRLKPIYTIDRGLVNYKGASYPLNESKGIVSDVDVIVVTPVGEYQNIKKMLKEHISLDVISLEEVILSL